MTKIIRLSITVITIYLGATTLAIAKCYKYFVAHFKP